MRNLHYARLWTFGVNVSAIRQSNPSDDELADFVNKLTILMKKYRVQVVPMLALFLLFI
jgi:thiamine monophosphate synthase